MKWENRNINVEEHANGPHFNKQHNAGAPLRLSESFFVDVLVDMIVGNTKLYGHSEKAAISLEISNETFCLFSGMVLLRGCHMLSDRKIYWETSPELRNLHHCCSKQHDK